MERQTKRTAIIAGALLAAAILSPSIILARSAPLAAGLADPTPRPTPTVVGVLPMGGIIPPRQPPTVVGVNPAPTGGVGGIVSTPTLPPTDTE